MTTYIANGTGSLFNPITGERLATVDYRICRTPHEDKPEEWWGRFAITYSLPELSEYLIELEDGRRGLCKMKMTKAQQMMGSDTYRHYELTGCGGLK